MDQPFSIQGIKIPVLATEAIYADLTGGVLDTSLYEPWADVVESIRASGANSVTLIVSAGVLRNHTDNDFDPTLSYNPSEAAIRALVSLIQGAGLDVVINPFVHIANVITGDGSQQGADRARPTDPALWQQNFAESVLDWAAFAEEVGATGFIPFTDETQHLLGDAQLTSGWLELIQDIRGVFSGHLSSGWWTDGTGIAITSLPASIIAGLDSLGIGFFPNLTNDTDATLDELKAAYREDAGGNDLVALLEDLAATYDKPIWITDKAFHSFDGAAADEARIFDNSIPLVADPQEQALLYESFLQVMSENNSGWFAGVSFQSYNNVRDDSGFLPRYLNGALSESPQDKPAEAVLTAWFQGLEQGPGVVEIDSYRDSTIAGGYHHDTLTGGAGSDTLVGLQGDDVFHAGAPAGGVSGYVVTLSLRGVATLGIPPVVTARDANGTVVGTATVSAPLSGGSATALSFEVETKSGFTLEMDNWTFVDMSATGNRFVRIESMKINNVNVQVSNSTVTYVSSFGEEPGKTDGVHGGEFRFNFSSVQVASVPLTVSADNDRIEGGAGLDTAVYAAEASAFTVTRQADAFTVSTASPAAATDTLLGVERIQFSDSRLALDVDGDAGTVAKLLGAVFGAEWAANQTYVGIGLQAADSGLTDAALASLALTARLGAYTNDALVRHLYENLAGEPAPTPLVDLFVAQLDSGALTPAGLALFAANHAINLQNIGFAELQMHGIAYV